MWVLKDDTWIWIDDEWLFSEEEKEGEKI